MCTVQRKYLASHGSWAESLAESLAKDCCNFKRLPFEKIKDCLIHNGTL